MLDNLYRENRELFKIIFGIEGILLIMIPILIMIMIVAYAIIHKIYKERFITEDIKILRKFTPLRVLTLVVMIYTLFIIPFSFNKVLKYNEEIYDLNYEVHKRYSPVDDRYRTSMYNNLNIHARYTYDKYHFYFAGYQRHINGNTLYVTEDSPTELIQYLDEHNERYEVVKHSYIDLQYVMSHLIYEFLPDEDFSGISIDFERNCIVLELAPEEYDLSSWQHYIDEGVLIVYLDVTYELM